MTSLTCHRGTFLCLVATAAVCGCVSGSCIASCTPLCSEQGGSKFCWDASEHEQARAKTPSASAKGICIPGLFMLLKGSGGMLSNPEMLSSGQCPDYESSWQWQLQSAAGMLLISTFEHLQGQILVTGSFASEQHFEFLDRSQALALMRSWLLGRCLDGLCSTLSPSAAQNPLQEGAIYTGIGGSDKSCTCACMLLFKPEVLDDVSLIPGHDSLCGGLNGCMTMSSAMDEPSPLQCNVHRTCNDQCMSCT